MKLKFMTAFVALVMIVAPAGAAVPGATGGLDGGVTTAAMATDAGSIASYPNTTAVDANDTSPDGLDGAVRVDSEVVNNTTVTGSTDVRGELAVTVNVSGSSDPANVTVYLAEAALNGSANGSVSNVTVTAGNGTNATDRNVTTVTAANETWYGFLLADASDTNVTVTYELATATEPTLAAFNDTAALDGNDTSPAALADALRVDADRADGTAAELLADEVGFFSTRVAVGAAANNSSGVDTGNLSVYVAQSALAGTDVSNVSVTARGSGVNDTAEALNVTAVAAMNDTWYGVLVPNAENATLNVTYDGVEDSAAIAPVNETTELDANDTSPESLDGAVRVETPYVNDTTAELTNVGDPIPTREASSTVVVDSSTNATNATVYLALDALAAYDITNVSTVTVDGEAVNTSLVNVTEEPASNTSNNTTSTTALDANLTATVVDDAANASHVGFNVASVTNASVVVSYDVEVAGYVTGLPEGVLGPNMTRGVGGLGVTPKYFSGKSRVDKVSDPAVPSTAVNLLSDDDTNLSVDITVGESFTPAPTFGDDPLNTSYYLRYDIAAGNASPSNVVVLVNGTPTEFGVVAVNDSDSRTREDYDWLGNASGDMQRENMTDDGNSTGNTSVNTSASVNGSGELYLAFLVPNATDEDVTVLSPEGTEIEGVYDEEGDGDGNARQGPPVGPYNGTPPGAEPFSRTTTLGPNSIVGNDTSLAGKVRVESGYAANTTIELVNNSTDNATLAITVTGNASDVTFYINQNAIEASQNIDTLLLSVDGKTQQFGEVEQGPGAWIGFEVDHFSTRIVTLNSTSTSVFSSTLPGSGGQGPPTDVDGDGSYEDINGDGRFTFTDVIALVFSDFDQINANFSSSQIAALDYDGNGRVTFTDVIDLVFQL
jgi:hypothetical protein